MDAGMSTLQRPSKMARWSNTEYIIGNPEMDPRVPSPDLAENFYNRGFQTQETEFQRDPVPIVLAAW